MMKKWFLVCLVFVTPWALADGHGGMTLEKRQPDTSMTVTSAQIGDAVSVINAEGDMGAYGRVYVTFNLEYDATRTGGKVYGQGRGFAQEGYSSGKFTGYWQMTDGVVTMRHVVQLADGTQNLDMVKVTPLSKELIVSAYVLN